MDDEIQAPKVRMPKVKNEIKNVKSVSREPIEPIAMELKEPIIETPIKPKKQLSEKQKETLARGRENLKKKKEEQLKETQKYKDEMILLKAEQLKNHKKEIKKSVGLPPESDEEYEEECLLF